MKNLKVLVVSECWKS